MSFSVRTFSWRSSTSSLYFLFGSFATSSSTFVLSLFLALERRFCILDFSNHHSHISFNGSTAQQLSRSLSLPPKSYPSKPPTPLTSSIFMLLGFLHMREVKRLLEGKRFDGGGFRRV